MAIIVKDISKEYKQKTNYSLKKISFEVADGEIFGLIGHNGSGKSTILKILAGVLTPSTGCVFIDDVDTRDNGSYLREKMGIMIEPERAMYWRLSGEENLMRVAKLKGIPMDTARLEIAHYMKALGIYEEKDKLVLNYSKGMKVKIAFIAALLGEPQILLLDEPLVGLDVLARNTVIDILKRYSEKGHIIIICENNLDVMEKLCDTVLLLQQGKQVALGKPRNLVEEIEGEGIIVIKAEEMDELQRYFEKPGTECVKIILDEEGLQIYTRDILKTITEIREQKFVINSLSFRERNLSDYFIMKGKVKDETDN